MHLDQRLSGKMLALPLGVCGSWARAASSLVNVIFKMALRIQLLGIEGKCLYPASDFNLWSITVNHMPGEVDVMEIRKGRTKPRHMAYWTEKTLVCPLRFQKSSDDAAVLAH